MSSSRCQLREVGDGCLILITGLNDNLLILQGEKIYKSLLGVKGLRSLRKMLVRMHASPVKTRLHYTGGLYVTAWPSCWMTNN